MGQALIGAACALLGVASWSAWRAVLTTRRSSRWVGDLRPGLTIEGPNPGEVWTVTGTTLSADRGQPPTLRIDLVAGAAPRHTQPEEF